ncbi:MAG TPA: hypothetical protein VM389_03005, partial [Phycisphaerae bacterium]|nr:hypothetical protein [Phycisphaerae bacterium]
MSQEARNPSRKWLWRLAGGATALIVLAGLGVFLYSRIGPRVWTDDRGIRRAESDARIRQVLWTEPQGLGGELNTPEQEYEPALAPGGEVMYFVRGLPGKGADIYTSRRSDEDGWGLPEPVQSVNTEHDELGPRVSPDGRFLLFYSDRPGGQGQYDIWAAERTGKGWGRPFNLGPAVNSKWNEYGATMDAAGGRLYFATNRKAAERRDRKEFWRATIRQDDVGDYDLFVAERAAPATRPATGPAAGEAEPPLALAEARELEGVNTRAHEGACCLSPGGDFLYFASNRPGGVGGFDLFRCRLRDGRCGPVEDLGPAINTPANETDPQLAMSGFRLYFSSDREGTRGGYDLFVSESHEVYAVRTRRPLPALGWSAWGLLIALAVLIPLLLYLRAAGYRHLSLFQKCVAVSLLGHILLTVLLSLWNISQVFIEYVAQEAGMTVAVNLEVAREVEVKQQVRYQISDLPVADRSLTDLRKVEPTVAPRAAPSPAELNVPRAQIKPASVTVAPQIPPMPPRELQEQVSLPPPRVVAEIPRIRIQQTEPIEEAERRPEPLASPSPVRMRPVAIAAPQPPQQPVRIRPSPAAPAAEPVAQIVV